MAWAYVQDVEDTDDSAENPENLPSFSATTGNAIIVAVYTIRVLAAGGYISPSSLSDTAGNTYNLLGSHDIEISTYRIRLHIYAAYNITGHASNVIAINGISSVGVRAIACEFSGLATSSTQDTGYEPSGNVDATSPYTTTADTTAEDNELVFAAFADTSATITFSSSSPSVFRQQVSVLAVATLNQDSAGSCSVSVAGSANQNTQCLARAFKQAAGGASSTPLFRRRLNILLRLCLSTFNLIWRCFK